MLKLNNNFPETPILTSPTHAERVGHIVVLLSTMDAELMDVTRKVWDLAQASGAPVRLIGLCSDKTQEPGIRRTLVSMASMLNHGDMTASIETLVGNNWLETVKFHLDQRDIVVCWDEPRAGLWKKPFSAVLQSHLDVPLYILSRPRQVPAPRLDLAKAAAAWAGFLGILIGFLLLQIKLYQNPNSWTITLEILAIACEFWLLWVWNRLFQ